MCNIYLTLPTPFVDRDLLTDQGGGVGGVGWGWGGGEKAILVSVSKIATMVAYDVIAMRRAVLTFAGSSCKD